MHAVDTNVVVRFLVNDDPDQSKIATDLFRQSIFIPATVLLECFWVLRSRYLFDRQRLAAALTALVTWPTVVIDNDSEVEWAIARFAEGADFEDALHIANAGSAEVFVTFDSNLTKRLSETAPVPVSLLS
jgi:predicted nucleic-acid-binding protein